MQLRPKPNLEISDAFGIVVLCEFICDALTGIGSLHDSDSILEAGEVLFKIFEAVLEDGATQLCLIIAGQFHSLCPSEFDKCADTQRAVEVYV